MRSTDSPLEKKPLKLCTVGEFLEILASAAMLPGAGAAGGVALALAAACAGKAVAISRLHDANSTVLKDLQLQLAHMADTALVLGQQDALQFKQQLESGDPAATNALLRTDHSILDVCRILDMLLQDNQQHIADNMAGDWKAATALVHACQAIHQENVRELNTDTEAGSLAPL